VFARFSISDYLKYMISEERPKGGLTCDVAWGESFCGVGSSGSGSVCGVVGACVGKGHLGRGGQGFLSRVFGRAGH
jgi:hypothetical protein